MKHAICPRVESNAQFDPPSAAPMPTKNKNTQTNNICIYIYIYIYICTHVFTIGINPLLYKEFPYY